MADTYEDTENPGSFVVLDSETEVKVEFHPQGGGFQYSTTPEKFHNRFVRKELPTELEWGYFELDGDDDGVYFKGLWNPSYRWNGWVEPSFSRDEIDKVLSYCEGWSTRWDQDVLHIESEWSDPEELHPREIDGVQYYTFPGWCWMNVSEEQKREYDKQNEE